MPQHRNQRDLAKGWALTGLIGVPIVLLLVVTAVRFPVGGDFLIPFGMMLIGAGLLAHTILRWGFGGISSRIAWAGAAAGALAMVHGALLLSSVPVWATRAAGVVFPLLFLLVLAYWVRAARRSA